MGRPFLVGAATTFLLLVLGLRLDSRMPDPAGPGEETVSLHGVCVYRREISRANAGRHSPYPAFAVAAGVIAAGSITVGCVAALLARRRMSAEPVAEADRTSGSTPEEPPRQVS